jgi:hypothetical protein
MHAARPRPLERRDRQRARHQRGDHKDTRVRLPHETAAPRPRASRYLRLRKAGGHIGRTCPVRFDRQLRPGGATAVVPSSVTDVRKRHRISRPHFRRCYRSVPASETVIAATQTTGKGRAPRVSTRVRLTLASVSNCGSADIVVRHDRWSPGVAVSWTAAETLVPSAKRWRDTVVPGSQGDSRRRTIAAFGGVLSCGRGAGSPWPASVVGDSRRRAARTGPSRRVQPMRS